MFCISFTYCCFLNLSFYMKKICTVIANQFGKKKALLLKQYSLRCLHNLLTYFQDSLLERLITFSWLLIKTDDKLNEKEVVIPAARVFSDSQQSSFFFFASIFGSTCSLRKSRVSTNRYKVFLCDHLWFCDETSLSRWEWSLPGWQCPYP